MVHNFELREAPKLIREDSQPKMTFIFPVLVNGDTVASQNSFCVSREVQSGKGTFKVESYLHHQGRKLVERFDANTYITLTKAMDLHDLSRGM